jgi:tetratricopeptide (TPR) repeat protein
MKLARRQEPSIDPDIELSVSIETLDPSQYEISSSTLTNINAQFSTKYSEEGSQLEEIIIEQDNRGAVHPSILSTENIENHVTKDLKMVVSKSEPITLRVYCKTTESEIGPFTFKIPPYTTIQFAENLLGQTSGKVQIKDLVDHFGTDVPSDAIFKLLGQIDRWIPLRTHFQVLDVGARASEEIEQSISEEGTLGFLSRQIAFPNSEVAYSIRSMQELDQIVSTCSKLEAIPNVSKYDILGNALGMIEQENMKSQFWEMETQFEIGRDHWQGLLRDDQMTALLATSVAKKDFVHARDMIRSWIGRPSKSGDIDELIEQAKENPESDLDTWRHLLPEAIEGTNQQLSYVISIYLRNFLISSSEFNIELFLQELIFEGRAKIAKRINLELDAKIAEYNLHHRRGTRLWNEENYSDAASEFDNALSVALTHEDNNGTPNLINPLVPIYWLYRIRGENKQQKGNHSGAIKELEKGINIIENYNIKIDTGDKNKEFYINRLKAKKCEIKGDKTLIKQNLEDCKKMYGMAIDKYQKINRESEVSYLLKRRGLITASLAEQRGDFDSAKVSHENVANLADDDSFASFNKSRATICEAKEELINGNLGLSRDLIDPHIDTFGLPGAEADHLELLLDVLDAYEKEEVQDVEKVFNRLESLPEIEEVAEQFPFEYGHEYRPALANILTAQRLQKIGVDKTLLEKLIDISLGDVLAPEQAKHEIDQWGIANLGLQQQWQQKLPTHVVRRYQEIEADAVTTNQNLSDQTFGLFRLLEQTIEFSCDYFIHKDQGSNWQHNYTDQAEGKLTLGDLRNVLDIDIMNERVWIDEVIELLDKPILDSNSMLDARNLFGHDRQSHLSREGYNEVIERIEKIFTLLASEAPILGKVTDEHKMGPYIFELFWPNVTDWCYLSVEEELDTESVYYLPPNISVQDRVIEPDSDDIVQCSSNRVLNNLENHTNFENKDTQ